MCNDSQFTLKSFIFWPVIYIGRLTFQTEFASVAFKLFFVCILSVHNAVGYSILYWILVLICPFHEKVNTLVESTLVSVFLDCLLLVSPHTGLGNATTYIRNKFDKPSSITNFTKIIKCILRIKSNKFILCEKINVKFWYFLTIFFFLFLFQIFFLYWSV